MSHLRMHSWALKAGLLSAALMAAVWPSAGSAAETIIHQYSALAIDPAGKVIAAVESAEIVGSISDAHGEIVFRDVNTGAVTAHFDPCPRCRYDGLIWSPDGHGLALLASDRQTGITTLDVIEDGGVRTLAKITGVAQAPRWSPDGKTLAVLAIPGAHKLIGATQAGASQVGEVGLSFDEKRIGLIPASGGELTYVSPADTYVYDYDWTPDGSGFAATAAKGDGDSNWWVAKLIHIDISTGAVRVLASPKMQMGNPRVSPDGKSVAFIGGRMSDYGRAGDIYTVPIKGGEPIDATPHFKGTFLGLMWRDGALLATALVGDQSVILPVDPSRGAGMAQHTAAETWSAGDERIVASFDGPIVATVAEDFVSGPRIIAGPPAHMMPITHENESLSAHVTAKSVTWRNGRFQVQGWLLAPQQYDVSMKQPMIVVIHGGPTFAVTPTYLYNGAVYEFIKHGYLVFMPNPRGSVGQGADFVNANYRDFGGGDFSDIIAGIDAVEKIAPIDDKRLGVYGHSYGGFMTMWVVTHSTRFHAAVADAGVSDWLSYYGLNGIDQWMMPFFGASAYDDPAIYAKLSPISTIKAARTPTLITVGERDIECPAEQSIEFWHGLKEMGVPTSLMIYAGEGHHLIKPENKQDLTNRINAWFDKYLARR